jgi:hypothetical protein
VQKVFDVHFFHFIQGVGFVSNGVKVVLLVIVSQGHWKPCSWKGFELLTS